MPFGWLSISFVVSGSASLSWTRYTRILQFSTSITVSRSVGEDRRGRKAMKVLAKSKLWPAAQLPNNIDLVLTLRHLDSYPIEIHCEDFIRDSMVESHAISH